MLHLLFTAYNQQSTTIYFRAMVSETCGVIVSDTISVNVSPPPVVRINPSGTVYTDGQDSVQLQIEVTLSQEIFMCGTKSCSPMQGPCWIKNIFRCNNIWVTG